MKNAYNAAADFFGDKGETFIQKDRGYKKVRWSPNIAEWCVLAVMSTVVRPTDWSQYQAINARQPDYRHGNHLITDVPQAVCKAIVEAKDLATEMGTWTGYTVNRENFPKLSAEMLEAFTLPAASGTMPMLPKPAGTFPAPDNIVVWLSDTGTALHLVEERRVYLPRSYSVSAESLQSGCTRPMARQLRIKLSTSGCQH